MLWARVRGRSGDDGRDACGEPWMLGFDVVGSEVFGSSGGRSGSETFERPEVHDPERAHVLVGRDVDDHAAPAPHPEPEPSLDAVEPAPPPPVEPVDDDRALVDALHRVADSFERVAESLDADRRARRETLDDVDTVLRALVGELRSPAAVPPVVLAGTIDATDAARPLEPGADTIDLTADADRRPFERARRR